MNRYLALMKKSKEREREIMKHVPGWNFDEPIYHSKKSWAPATLSLVPS
jgi:hypothetical protein